MFFKHRSGLCWLQFRGTGKLWERPGFDVENQRLPEILELPIEPCFLSDRTLFHRIFYLSPRPRHWRGARASPPAWAARPCKVSPKAMTASGALKPLIRPLASLRDARCDSRPIRRCRRYAPQPPVNGCDASGIFSAGNTKLHRRTVFVPWGSGCATAGPAHDWHRRTVLILWRSGCATVGPTPDWH